MNIPKIAKRISAENNVCIRVLDIRSGIVLSEHHGHNSATNTMLLGIAHYLKGDGVLNQGHEMLSSFVPRYISLGTMGLINQDSDSSGLPLGIGVSETKNPDESDEQYEIRRFKEYMEQQPGYGADGYNAAQNNGRLSFGLGPQFYETAVKCELISPTFGRSPITYRTILPEVQAELPETIDVVFSAMISTGALAQFRGDNDYVFITEVGMWSKPNWENSSQNGLVAGYRIVPPNSDNYDMDSAANRQILKQNILRVGKNQVVQVIWKIQLGIAGSFAYDSSTYRYLMEIIEELIDHHVEVVAPDIAAPISMAVEPSYTGTATKQPIMEYGETIGCDSDFFFGVGDTCSCILDGRSYTTLPNMERIALVLTFKSGNNYWTHPVFMSTNPDAVTYIDSYSHGQNTYKGTVEYPQDSGVTWYYSQDLYAMGSALSDSSGCIFSYVPPDGVYPSSYTPELVVSLLEYVSAVAI